MNLEEITDQNLEDLVDTAWYGAVNYWASPSHIPIRRTDSEGIFMALVDREGEAPEPHYLTGAALREAYGKLVDVDQPFVNATIHGYFLDSWRNRTEEDGIEMGSIDAEAADVWVQVACFGEVVYG